MSVFIKYLQSKSRGEEIEENDEKKGGKKTATLEFSLNCLNSSKTTLQYVPVDAEKEKRETKRNLFLVKTNKKKTKISFLS